MPNPTRTTWASSCSVDYAERDQPSGCRMEGSVPAEGWPASPESCSFHTHSQPCESLCELQVFVSMCLCSPRTHEGSFSRVVLSSAVFTSHILNLIVLNLNEFKIKLKLNYQFSSSVAGTTFQVFNTQVWPMAAILDSTDKTHCCHDSKAYYTGLF